MMPLDSTRDVTRQRITQLVKSAVIDPATANLDVTPPTNLPAESYADPVRKILPCHTKEATIISAGYYYSDPAAYGAQSQNLIQGQLALWADRHGVYDEMMAVKNAMEGILPDPTDNDFAFGTDIPIRDDREVKIAAEHLIAFSSVYLPDDRRSIAESILSRGDNLSTATRGAMEKLAGLGYAKPAHVVNEIQNLAALCRQQRHFDTATVIDRLGQATAMGCEQKKVAFLHADVIRPLVSIIDTAMRSHFGRGVDETRFYQQTPAGIQDYLYKHAKLANNTVVRIQDFNASHTSTVAGLFGTKIASDLATAGDVSRKTLQGLTAKQADDLLRVTGVVPVSRSHAFKLRLEDLPAA